MSTIPRKRSPFLLRRPAPRRPTGDTRFGNYPQLVSRPLSDDIYKIVLRPLLARASVVAALININRFIVTWAVSQCLETRLGRRVSARNRD